MKMPACILAAALAVPLGCWADPMTFTLHADGTAYADGSLYAPFGWGAPASFSMTFSYDSAAIQEDVLGRHAGGPVTLTLTGSGTSWSAQSTVPDAFLSWATSDYGPGGPPWGGARFQQNWYLSFVAPGAADSYELNFDTQWDDSTFAPFDLASPRSATLGEGFISRVFLTHLVASEPVDSVAVYADTWNIAALAAVPEPPPYAVLLGGFGALWWWGRHRRPAAPDAAHRHLPS